MEQKNIKKLSVSFINLEICIAYVSIKPIYMPIRLGARCLASNPFSLLQRKGETKKKKFFLKQFMLVKAEIFTGLKIIQSNLRICEIVSPPSYPLFSLSRALSLTCHRLENLCRTVVTLEHYVHTTE